MLAALKHGKHVLCEKPLAVTTAEVRQIAAAAKAAKKTVMTAQNMRWGAALCSRSSATSTAGALGDVYYSRIHAVRRHWIPTSPTFIDHAISGGGPCMDIGVHALDPRPVADGLPPTRCASPEPLA